MTKKKQKKEKNVQQSNHGRTPNKRYTKRSKHTIIVENMQMLDSKNAPQESNPFDDEEAFDLF